MLYKNGYIKYDRDRIPIKMLKSNDFKFCSKQPKKIISKPLLGVLCKKVNSIFAKNDWLYLNGYK